jgi:hypothetical protein
VIADAPSVFMIRIACTGLDPPLLLVLDEAANIAPLRDLAQVASTAAGLGIQLVTVWQDRADRRTLRPARRDRVNNHRAKLVLSGITATTTGYLAQVIGDTDVVRHSTTTDAEGRTSATRAPRPRCSPAPQRSASSGLRGRPRLRPLPTHRAAPPQPDRRRFPPPRKTTEPARRSGQRLERG